MNRREFLGRIAAVPMAAVAASSGKPIVRMATDCDLSVCSLLWAEQQAGFVDPPGRYILTVHPSQAPFAERVLRHEFGNEWRASLVLDDSIADVDSWYLTGSRATVYSAGA